MEKRIIFVVMPFTAEFTDVYDAVKEAADRSQDRNDEHFSVMRADLKSVEGTVSDHVKKAIRDADLVVADTSQSNPNVLYEIGLAEAYDKPLITINQESYQVPFDISQRNVLFYDRSRLKKDLVPHLADAITEALREPTQFTGETEKASTKPKAFVSYSRADKDHLDRMMVHLRPLQKRDLVDVWRDTRIKAGEKWEEEIMSALSEAAIAVLLISADFLASDFIVDNELPPLLESAEHEGTRILPVILKPCRFTRDKKLSQFQALNDPPEPLLLQSKIEQEAIWDQLALAMENEIESYMP